MGKLATLPVFLKLEGRRVVIAGGSEAAAWKAELFASAGAQVEVYATEPCETLAALADGQARVAITPRALAPEDLAGAAVLIADAQDAHMLLIGRVHQPGRAGQADDGDREGQPIFR